MKTFTAALLLSFSLPPCVATQQETVHAAPAPGCLPTVAAMEGGTAPPKKIPGEDRILRTKTAQNPRFLPESYLAAVPLEAVPLTETARENLRGRIQDADRYSRDPSRPSPVCVLGVLEPDGPRPTANDIADPFKPSEKSFADYFQSSAIVARALVVRKEAGWDGALLRVVTRVDVLVLDSLKDETRGSAAEGKLLAFVEDGGAMTLQGGELCSHDVSRLDRDAVGDDVLVLAHDAEGTPGYVRAKLYRIVEGIIGAKPISDRFPILRGNMPYEDLVRLAAEERGRP